MMGAVGFIPNLLRGEYDAFFDKMAAVVLLWFLVILASVIDLITGIAASKAAGNFNTTSKGLRKTLLKDLHYFAVLFVMLLMDVALSYLSISFSIFGLPLCSIGGVLVIIGIESWSVQENIKRRRKGSADILDITAEVIKAIGDEKVKDVVEAVEAGAERHLQAKTGTHKPTPTPTPRPKHKPTTKSRRNEQRKSDNN